MTPDSPERASIRLAHPLAIAAIERLRHFTNARVLELGAGSGRNTAALLAAGLRVDALAEGQEITDRSGRYAAVLSTHALLHGTPVTIAGHAERIAAALHSGGLLFATFGSVRDARYGVGVPLDAYTFAPASGDELGVPHAFFDEVRLRALLVTGFTIESLAEHCVDAIAGHWAHPQERLRDARHWFVIATRK